MGKVYSYWVVYPVVADVCGYDCVKGLYAEEAGVYLALHCCGSRATSGA